ncbi:MAG: leucine-rich repeat domain-containing protein, partial [Muribaculaceae bacterium]|nr:leucine-rich repeat domain-containing protein [Muribaculaceae bacterium]
VVNVAVGNSFTVRANAIKVPNGAEASKFFAMALTDKNGAIKEIISPIMTNSMTNSGNLTYNFGCQVKEASVKEGNELRLITSYNKRNWTVVNADAKGVTDRIQAIGNQVAYHSVNMPQSVTGAKIEGAVTEIVRGMPLNIKVTPDSPLQRVTLAVNGVNKAVSAAVANVTVPAVTEDIEITISIHDAGASDYVVVNVQEGELAAKIAECPDRLKVMGTILVDEFAAFRAHANQILDLDLADMTIKGAAMTANSIPSNAFAPTQAGVSSALRSIILPKNLERISDNAFSRCGALKEVVIPASVTYVGSGAFSSCNQLSKITMEGSTPPATGTMSPFPSNASGIALEVPRGAEGAYSTGYWGEIGPKAAKSYYWVKYDPTMIAPWSSNYDLNKLEVGSSNIQPQVALPNCPALSKSEKIRRPGAIFKLYDNGHFIFDTNFFGTSVNSIKSTFAPSQYGYGGQYIIHLDPTYASTSWRYPKNHELEIVFFHSITLETLEGADGVTSQLVDVDPEDVYNAELYLFTYGATGNKTVYREGKDYKVRLNSPSPNLNLSVQIENKILVKPGENPTFETKQFEVYPDGDGLYTIPALPGDTWIKVTGSVQVIEGEPIPAEDLGSVDKTEVEAFVELAVTGNMDEDDYNAIREKFDSVESIDLTGIENESIPAGAFEGMDQLKDVIVPETVTEIGAGAFAGCENIESLTLPGVTSIGEGAFEGCDNLTSILLPALGSGVSSGKPGMRRADGVGGVSVESFKGLNPNCLIYVGSVDVPGAESLNIILNID